MAPKTADFLQAGEVKLEEVIHLPRNPKDHDLGSIHDSMEIHGFVERPVLNRRTMHVISGNGRILSLRQRKSQGVSPPRGIKESKGSWIVPVDFIDCDEAEEEAVALAVNRLVELGGWRQDILAQVLADRKVQAGGLRGTGFTEEDADAMLAYWMQVRKPEDGSKSDVPSPVPPAEIGKQDGVLRVPSISEQVERERVGFRLETVAVSDLKPHPRNYATHPDDEIEHLCTRIQEQGLYRNIVVAVDGTILAGHGVVEAVKRLGMTAIPAVRIPLDPEDPRALKILVGDNEVAHLAEKDDRLLTELLKEIKDADWGGLPGTGFDERMLATLVFVTRPEGEIADFDEAAHWVGMPDYDEGEKCWKVIINFEDEAEMKAFAESLDMSFRRKPKLWTGWWGKKGHDDLSSVRFEG